MVVVYHMAIDATRTTMLETCLCFFVFSTVKEGRATGAMIMQRLFYSTLFLVLVCCGGFPALGSDTPGKVGDDAISPTPSPESSEPATLYLASFANDISIVEDLLAKGAEVDAILGNGATPLWIAASMGHVQIVNMLLRAGADVSKTVKPVITTPTPWDRNGIFVVAV